MGFHLSELLASVVALVVFGWMSVGRRRKNLQITLSAGTDNQANESLFAKRATSKWPLMAINMQMSAMLARARISLNLNWRPGEENTEADDLTNERFDGFGLEKRVVVKFSDLEFDILRSLVDSHDEFERAKQTAREFQRSDVGSKSKKFEKTPW